MAQFVVEVSLHLHPVGVRRWHRLLLTWSLALPATIVPQDVGMAPSEAGVEWKSNAVRPLH